jgi:hypothetical protein
MSSALTHWLFRELLGPHTAGKSVAARVLLRTPIAERTIDSWLSAPSIPGLSGSSSPHTTRLCAAAS